jgi:hypothetical protein
MYRRMESALEKTSLNLVSYHVRALAAAGLIELFDIKQNGKRREHIYRAIKRQFFSVEEWEAIDPKLKQPLLSTILQQISEDTSRSAAEGKFSLIPDSHLSRSPIELDQEGWQKVVDRLAETLDDVLEAYAESKERAYDSGERLMPVRVVRLRG